MDAVAGLLRSTQEWIAADPYLKSVPFNAPTVLNPADPLSIISVPKYFPSTLPFYSDFELSFSNGLETSMFALDTLPAVLLVCAAYVVSIFAIKLYMRDKKFKEVRQLQFFWNAGLAIFSIIGALRMVCTHCFGFAHNECNPSRLPNTDAAPPVDALPRWAPPRGTLLASAFGLVLFSSHDAFPRSAVRPATGKRAPPASGPCSSSSPRLAPLHLSIIPIASMPSPVFYLTSRRA
jgi:hypothetical protein